MSPGLAGVSSDSLDLAQVIRQAVFTTQPGGAVSGAPFTTQPVVEMRDHANLLYPVNSGTVTAFLASGTVVNIVNGVARFTDLSITGTGPFTLGLIVSLPVFGVSAPSATFTVSP